MERIICSICSREKDTSDVLLPAHKRYRGDHVGKVERIALSQGLPFFILSGLYGMVPYEDPIPYYDFLLTEAKVSGLVEMLKIQLQQINPIEICFYTKRKPTWVPYLEALQKATEVLGVSLSVYELAEND